MKGGQGEKWPKSPSKKEQGFELKVEDCEHSNKQLNRRNTRRKWDLQWSSPSMRGQTKVRSFRDPKPNRKDQIVTQIPKSAGHSKKEGTRTHILLKNQGETRLCNKGRKWKRRGEERKVARAMIGPGTTTKRVHIVKRLYHVDQKQCRDPGEEAKSGTPLTPTTSEVTRSQSKDGEIGEDR